MNITFKRLLNITSDRAKAVLATTIFAALVLSNVITYAGGRPVGKKRLFINVGASYFFNSQFWDQDKQVQNYSFNAHNSSLSASLSAEYGFSRRVSLMASVPFVSNTVKSDISSNTINSIGDGQVGVRYYIANISYRTYFSVQSNLIFPLYVNTAAVTRGYGQLGTSLTFAGSGDFKMFNKGFFFEADISSSKYFGSDAPFQGTFTASIGFSISKYYQLSFSESSARSYSITKDLNPLSPAPAKDYSSNQVTAGISRGLGRSRSLSLSYTTFISGRNTAIGSSFSLGYGFKY
jgi:protein XagA